MNGANVDFIIVAIPLLFPGRTIRWPSSSSARSKRPCRPSLRCTTISFRSRITYASASPNPTSKSSLSKKHTQLWIIICGWHKVWYEKITQKRITRKKSGSNHHSTFDLSLKYLCFLSRNTKMTKQEENRTDLIIYKFARIFPLRFACRSSFDESRAMKDVRRNISRQHTGSKPAKKRRIA